MVFEISSMPRENTGPRVPTNSPGTAVSAAIVPGATIAAAGDLVLRHARDEDAAAIIALISAVWSEYPGKILVPATDMPELLQPATAYARCDGLFWVVEANGCIIGTVALHSSDEPGVVELQKLYVARRVRRNGLGSFLCFLVDREARRRGADAIELWSDVKLLDAHRRYEREGYHRGPEIRARDDTSKTVQYYYRKRVAAAHEHPPAGDDDLSGWLGRWQTVAALHMAGEHPAGVAAA